MSARETKKAEREAEEAEEQELIVPGSPGRPVSGTTSGKVVGTSAFTHQDDRSAPIHTTHAGHHDALHYGAPEPKHEDRETIILGPPAFGSPDPATLGHTMNPLYDRPGSAPALDPAFHELQGTGHVVNFTEEEIRGMSKAELLQLARENDVPVKSNASRDELVSALLSDGDEGDEDDTGDDEE